MPSPQGPRATGSGRAESPGKVQGLPRGGAGRGGRPPITKWKCSQPFLRVPLCCQIYNQLTEGRVKSSIIFMDTPLFFL